MIVDVLLGNKVVMKLYRGETLIYERNRDIDLKIQEVIEKLNIKALTPKELEEGEVTIELTAPDILTFADEIEKLNIKILTPKELEEGEVTIDLELAEANFLTEEEDFNLVTEDKLYNITTERRT